VDFPNGEEAEAEEDVYADAVEAEEEEEEVDHVVDSEADTVPIQQAEDRIPDIIPDIILEITITTTTAATTTTTTTTTQVPDLDPAEIPEIITITATTATTTITKTQVPATLPARTLGLIIRLPNVVTRIPGSVVAIREAETTLPFLLGFLHRLGNFLLEVVAVVVGHVAVAHVEAVNEANEVEEEAEIHVAEVVV